jgi:hypothetical protein
LDLHSVFTCWKDYLLTWQFFLLVIASNMQDLNTVMIQVPDSPVFKWSFSEPFFGSVFEGLKSLQKPDRKFSTSSLVHFTEKNILFMTLLSIKQSRLVGTIQISDHLTTGHKLTIQIPESSGFWIITVVIMLAYIQVIFQAYYSSTNRLI